MTRTAFAAIGAIAIAVGAWLWLGRGPKPPPLPAAGAAEEESDESPDPERRTSPAPRGPSRAAPLEQAPAPIDPPTALAFDRAKRDQMREAIWRAFGQEAPDAGSPRKAAEYKFIDFVPPEPREGDGGGIEPKYIQENVRKQFFGPAMDCYTEAMGRLPNPRGSIHFYFVIAGDEKVGGIVESVDVLNKSTLRDPQMIECMRESFLSVTFPPPKGGGVVTVVYPIEFSPDDADE